MLVFASFFSAPRHGRIYPLKGKERKDERRQKERGVDSPLKEKLKIFFEVQKGNVTKALSYASHGIHASKSFPALKREEGKVPSKLSRKT